MDEIQKTKLKLSKKRKTVTSDTLSAELDFGFWTGMMASYYEKKIWQKHISKVFLDAPKNYNLVREFSTIRNELHEIRNLRNRVFHHEPIFCTKKLSFDDMLVKYNQSKKLIGWLSQDAFRLLDKHEQFSSFVLLIPPSMKSSIIQPSPSNPGKGVTLLSA